LKAIDRAIRHLAGGVAVLFPALAVAALVVTNHLQDRALMSNTPAPAEWTVAAGENDRLIVPGLDIAYWGKPDARYSNYATKGKEKPRGIVVHFTRVRPVLWMVKYGHVRDKNRGGASFGYHFYIGRDGKVVQGAPLSKRTNHIKSTKRKERTAVARHLWSGNTIGISMVGGCDKLLRPNAWWMVTNCSGEFLTPEQIKSGLAVIEALQKRYEMDCGEVHGHGALQTDRDDFEGATLTKRAKARCPAEVAKADENEKS